MGATAVEPDGRGSGEWPYRFEIVPLDRLFVDQAYQRPLSTFVDRIAEQYDPALVGTLIASERRRGKLAVVDGQTRMEAMRRNAETAAPCLIYEGLSQSEEARLFAKLQTQRRGMATYLRFRAALVAQDPEALAIREIVQAEGFELDIEETPATLKAVAALERIYRVDADDDGAGPAGTHLREVLRIVRQAWPDKPRDYVSGEILRGLSRLLLDNPNLDRPRLIARLGSVTPALLKRRAQALKEGRGSGGGSPGYMADAMLGIYMSRGNRGTSATT